MACQEFQWERENGEKKMLDSNPNEKQKKRSEKKIHTTNSKLNSLKLELARSKDRNDMQMFLIHFSATSNHWTVNIQQLTIFSFKHRPIYQNFIATTAPPAEPSKRSNRLIYLKPQTDLHSWLETKKKESQWKISFIACQPNRNGASTGLKCAPH